jgi:hypothetical protein
MPIHLGPARRESMATADYELFTLQKAAMRATPASISKALI